MKQYGYTLIELLVLIAILAIVGALIYPAITKKNGYIPATAVEQMQPTQTPER